MHGGLLLCTYKIVKIVRAEKPEETPEEPAYEVPESSFDRIRELLIATHEKDRGKRGALTAAMDADGWHETSLLLAVAKALVVRRERLAIERTGQDLWIRETAALVCERNSSWMRLQAGQVAGMIRAALGNRDLALTVAAGVRGRLDSNIVECLVADSVDYKSSFEQILDELLDEAAQTVQRKAMAAEFEGL